MPMFHHKRRSSELATTTTASLKRDVFSSFDRPKSKPHGADHSSTPSPMPAWSPIHKRDISLRSTTSTTSTALSSSPSATSSISTIDSDADDDDLIVFDDDDEKKPFSLPVAKPSSSSRSPFQQQDGLALPPAITLLRSFLSSPETTLRLNRARHLAHFEPWLHVEFAMFLSAFRQDTSSSSRMVAETDVPVFQSVGVNVWCESSTPSSTTIAGAPAMASQQLQLQLPPVFGMDILVADPAWESSSSSSSSTSSSSPSPSSASGSPAATAVAAAAPGSLPHRFTHHLLKLARGQRRLRPWARRLRPEMWVCAITIGGDRKREAEGCVAEWERRKGEVVVVGFGEEEWVEVVVRWCEIGERGMRMGLVWARVVEEGLVD